MQDVPDGSQQTVIWKQLAVRQDKIGVRAEAAINNR
jgi:hypothetical protein